MDLISALRTLLGGFSGSNLMYDTEVFVVPKSRATINLSGDSLSDSDCEVALAVLLPSIELLGVTADATSVP